MADRILKYLTRHIMTRIDGPVRNAVNNIEGMRAWSGIRGDNGDYPDSQEGSINNATKAFKNHYGFTTPNGTLVPPRPFIDSAVDNNEEVKAGHTKEAMRRAVLNEIRDSVIGSFKSEAVYIKKLGDVKNVTTRLSPTRAFGVHSTAGGVMEVLAKQMNENQKRAMVRTHKNAESTLKRKKSRSSQPLVDYGDMRKAVRYGVEK